MFWHSCHSCGPRSETTCYSSRLTSGRPARLAGVPSTPSRSEGPTEPGSPHPLFRALTSLLLATARRKVLSTGRARSHAESTLSLPRNSFETTLDSVRVLPRVRPATYTDGRPRSTRSSFRGVRQSKTGRRGFVPSSPHAPYPGLAVSLCRKEPSRSGRCNS